MSTTIRQSSEREFDFSDKEFKFLAGLANTKTGIVLADHKKDMVYGRLVRRLRALQLDSFRDYCEFLQSEQGGDEIGQLVNAITTNLTGFFREAHHFTHLHHEVLTPLVKKSPSGGRLRIWSSACSSGMEPYSLAMVMREAVADLSKWDAKILATDIDSNMVQTGKHGEYNESDVESVPAAYRSHILRGEKPGKVMMSAALKESIAYRQLNLLESWPFKGKFDVIFCRNVVIYFDKETKQKLFNRMAEVLHPNGWLYIGHSENLHGITDRFELIGRTIYRRIK